MSEPEAPQVWRSGYFIVNKNGRKLYVERSSKGHESVGELMYYDPEIRRLKGEIKQAQTEYKNLSKTAKKKNGRKKKN